MEEHKQYNAGYNRAELPAGIERAVLRVLDFHVGREAAISRSGLVMALGQVGFPVSEREARQVVNELRKAGEPICSTGGEGGGYWRAADWQELNAYIEHELHSRAVDLLEQESALRREAERVWGRFSPGVQVRMEI